MKILTSVWQTITADPGATISAVALSILAALLFSSSVSVLRVLVSIFTYFFRTEPLAGEWRHSYFNKNTNGFHFYSEKVKIKKGIFEKIRIISRDPDSNKVIFRGNAIREKGFLIVHGDSTRDSETVFQRFILPPPGGDQRLVGLSSAHDFNGQVSVNPSVLSQAELTQSTFVAIVQERIDVDSDMRVLTVRAEYGAN